METLEMLLRKHTWFTEGSTTPGAATAVVAQRHLAQRRWTPRARRRYNE